MNIEKSLKNPTKCISFQHPGHDHRHHGQRLGLGGGTPTTAQAGSTKPAFPVAIITGQNTTSPGEREPDHLPRTGQRPGLRQPTTDYAPVNQGFPLGGDTAIMLTIGETPIEPDVATKPDEAAGAARAWLATHGCS